MQCCNLLSPKGPAAELRPNPRLLKASFILRKHRRIFGWNCFPADAFSPQSAYYGLPDCRLAFWQNRINQGAKDFKTLTDKSRA